MKGTGTYAFSGEGATPNSLVEAIVTILQGEEDRDMVYQCRRKPLILEVDGREGESVITDWKIKNNQLVLRVEGQF
jgi:hypothetical protein